MGALIGVALGVLAIALLVTWLVTRLRRGRGEDIAPELLELDRALRRTGRPPLPPQTLRSLEERWRRHAPE